MAWGKSDDKTAFHPRVMALGSMRDERLLNEAWGFIHRAFCWSCSVYTDGFIPESMVAALAGRRGQVLVKAAIRAQILGTRIAKHPDTGVPGWFIILDADQLLHLRTKAELEAEAAYRAMLRNVTVWGPVRARDGDQCRYCGQVVNWKDTRGLAGKKGVLTAASGSLDHLIPGGDDLVVACLKCNGLKQDRPLTETGLTLNPPPEVPYYTTHTRDLLTENGYLPDPTALAPGQMQQTDEPARTQLEVETQRILARTTPSEPTQPLARTGTAGDAHHVAGRGDQAQTRDGPAARGVPNQARPGRVGSGRVGSGDDSTAVTATPKPARSAARGTRAKRKPPQSGAS